MKLFQTRHRERRMESTLSIPQTHQFCNHRVISIEVPYNLILHIHQKLPHYPNEPKGLPKEWNVFLYRRNTEVKEPNSLPRPPHKSTPTTTADAAGRTVTPFIEAPLEDVAMNFGGHFGRNQSPIFIVAPSAIRICH